MRTIGLMAAIAALGLAGCEEQPRKDTIWGPVPPAQGQEPPPPVAQDTTFMQGDWKLATLSDAAPPESAHPVSLQITAGRIEARSQCKRFAWTYTLTDKGFDASKAAPSEESCDRKFSLWELAFEEAITRANVAEMEMDGGLMLKGAGGQAKLER